MINQTKGNGGNITQGDKRSNSLWERESNEEASPVEDNDKQKQEMSEKSHHVE